MIILYAFIDEKKHEYLLNKYLDISSKAFKWKILKYRRWQDAQLSLLGRILLKYGLNYHFNIKNFEVKVTSDNKPFIADQKLHFNISHSKNIVVCIIAKFTVGIDVEFLDYKNDYLTFKQQMTVNEFDEISRSLDKIKSFFSYWTEKEAVIKAHGKGLLIPLQSFEVFNEQSSIDNEKFYLKEIFINEEYKCCIAAIEDIRQINIPMRKINLINL